MKCNWIRWAEVLALAAILAASCTREPPPKPRSLHPPPVTSVTPAFLAPRRGEILIEGQSFLIRWQAPGWQRVHIAAAMGGKDRGHLAMDRDASTDTMLWQIPVGWVTGFGVTRSDSVRLRLENASDPTQFVDSPPFTVTGEEP